MALFHLPYLGALELRPQIDKGVSLLKARVVLVSAGVVPRLITTFECNSIPRFVEVAGRW